MALTDAWLKANVGKARSKVEVKSDRDGLGARVTAKGKIVFQLRYRYAGKACRVDVGTYPIMGLKAARAECTRLQACLAKGDDPKTVLALEKVKKTDAKSLAEVFDGWYSAYCLPQKSISKQIKRTFEIHVFPRLGKLPAGELSVNEWLHLLEPVAKSTPHIADRIITNGRQMYKWAERRGYVGSNPLTNVLPKEDLQIRKRQRTRSLTDDEIRLIWDAVEQSRMVRKNELLFKLCLLYGCRKGEIYSAQKQHLDFEKGIWVVPPENHKVGGKTGKPLQRPIIDPAKKWFQELVELSPKSSYLMTKEKEPTERVKPIASLSIPPYVNTWIRRHYDIEVPHWSMHDLRRTARTNFSKFAPPHVAEVMLGHVLPGSWSVYDQYDYLDEQRKAYAAWWDKLRLVTAGQGS